MSAYCSRAISTALKLVVSDSGNSVQKDRSTLATGDHQGSCGRCY